MFWLFERSLVLSNSSQVTADFIIGHYAQGQQSCSGVATTLFLVSNYTLLEKYDTAEPELHLWDET